MTKGGSAWRSLLAVGFGLLLVLAFDQTVRLLLPPDAAPSEERPWYLRTVRYNPVLGWSGYPNFDETHDGIRIQTNSLGYRDREPSDVQDGMLRVLVLGDSFTWGDEVNQGERFSAVLETSCASQCGSLPPIHAINKGIIGYGTAQSFLQYVLTRQEQRFDLVILALFSGNDLTDNSAVDSHSGPRPRLIRCDPQAHQAELCLEGVPVPTVVDWPEHRLVNPRGQALHTFGWSGLMTLASRRRMPTPLLERHIATETSGLVNGLPFPMVERTSDAPIKDRIGQLQAILRAMDDTIRGEGKGFGVMVFPSARVYAGEAGDELRDYRDIIGVLDRLDIPFADYYEQTKDARWEDLFFELQGHWRPAGHQEAARLLRDLLVTMRARQR